MERYFVDPKCDKITREDLYLVRLEKADGEAISSLEPKRLFPFTRPSEYITLIGEDRKEAAVIRSIDELDEESKRAVLECFKEPVIIEHLLEVFKAYRKSPSTKSDSVHLVVAFLESHYRSIDNGPNGKDRQQNESRSKIEPRLPLLFTIYHN